MKVKYLKAAAGVPAGVIKTLPEPIAAELIRLGVAVEHKADSVSSKVKAEKDAAPKVKARKTASK